MQQAVREEAPPARNEHILYTVAHGNAMKKNFRTSSPHFSETRIGRVFPNPRCKRNEKRSRAAFIPRRPVRPDATARHPWDLHNCLETGGRATVEG